MMGRTGATCDEEGGYTSWMILVGVIVGACIVCIVVSCIACCNLGDPAHPFGDDGDYGRLQETNGARVEGGGEWRAIRSVA